MIQISMRTSFAVTLIVGVLFSVYAFAEAGKVVDCGAAAQNALRTVLITGIAMISVSATVLATPCLRDVTGSSYVGLIFLVLMLCLSIMTLVCVSIVMARCSAARNGWGWGVLILNVVTIIWSSYTLGSDVYKAISEGKAGKAATASASPALSPLAFRFYN